MMRKRTLRGPILLFILSFASPLWAQSNSPVQYVYDALGRLTTVVDPSGNVANYNYDAVGNLLSITRSTSSPSALAIRSFAPAQGSVGQTVTIQGQNFSTTPSSNTVQFNGTTATVAAATANSLSVTVPTGATTGPISVTVGTSTATSGTNFTVLSVPVITSINPTLALSSTTISNFQVTGVNLTGATFAFLPTFTPPAVIPSNVTIGSGGTSATMALTLAAGAVGSFSLVATNSSGSSTAVPSASNTLTIISTDPNADSDGDGLTNLYESAIGSNPTNPSTTNDGIPDGWAVFYGLSPLNSAAANQTAPDGLTYLQAFQRGVNPLIPNLVPPAVSNVFPANGATNYPTNGVVVVRFTEALLAGVDLATAQNAINAGLPAQSNFSSANASAAAQVLQAYLQRTCCGTSAVLGAVQILQNGRTVPGSVTLSNDRLSLTFAPGLPLSASTTFTISVQGVHDAAGNLMTQSFQSSFTTGLAANKTTPGAVFTNPPNGATGVEINTPIQLQFSAPVNPSTLSSQTFSVVDGTTNSALSGTLQTDPYGFTASFVPAQPYGVGRLILVTVSGIQDVAGNSFPLTSFSFTTGFNADNQGFHLVGTSPANSLTAVPLNALIVLQFDEPVDAISALTGLQVQLAGAPIPGAIALSDGNKRLTFTPSAPLAPNSTYLVVTTSRLTDFSGNQLLNPDSSTFLTGSAADTSAGPSVLSVSPGTPAPTNAIIQLQFSKRLNPLTVTSSTLGVFSIDTQSPVSGSFAVSADGLTVSFTPSSSLVPGTSYRIAPTAGVTDLVGTGFPLVCTNVGCYSFTTGGGAVTTAPTVVTVSPPNGTTGVQVNARVVVVASVPIAGATVGNNAVTVSAGGTPISGTVGIISNGTALSFTPSSLLSVSTTYTISVSGFTDQAGNTVLPFTSTFTTGTSGVPDTSTPAAVSVSPANGAGNVPVNSSVVVTFNKNIDPSSVNNNTVQISASNFAGALAGSYSVNGATVTFTPLTVLPGGTTIQVVANNYLVQDYAGTSAPCCIRFTSSFTTAAVADTTPPQVISVTPTNGATGIGQDTMVVLTFSKSLNPTTMNRNTIGLLVTGAIVPVQMSISADNRVVTLLPGAGTLPSSSTIAVVATTAVRDLSGNSLGNFVSLFTTAPAFDTKSPSVIGQRPANGASGVATNANVVLYASEPMNQSTVPGAFHVSQNGVLVSGQVQLTDSGQTIQFTPSVPFQNSALIQVFLDSTALDADGNNLTSYQASFRTVQDLTNVAPSIVNTNPLNTGGIPTNVVIDLGFNETLNPTTVNTTTVSLTQGTTVVPASVSLVGAGTIVQITPNAPLAANTGYSVQLTTGLLGTNGLPDSAAPGAVLSFTTGSGTDTVNPTIALISPPNGAVNVGNNANIRVRFSKAINPLTVNGNTISISGGSFTQVPYSTFFVSNQEVLITPNAPLPDATQMTLTVSGVTDIASNAIAAQTTHFTTGTGPDTVIPLVIQENPISGAGNVPVNTPIQLRMNEPIDPGTVNSNSLLVQNNNSGQAVAGSYSVSVDGQTISFVPSALLAASTNYRVFFENRGIADLAGNTLPNQQNGGLPNPGVSPFTFATGTTANTTAPQVVGVSPAGLTGVPINAQVLIQFNEPVDGLTLNQVTLSNGGGTVNVSKTLSNANQTLILTGVAPLLAPNTVYTVTVTGVQDVSGNSMIAPVTASFTTGAGADLTPAPNVVSTSPGNGATGVLTTTSIQLVFTKRLDPFTVTNSTLGVFVLSSQAPVAGTIAVSADGLTVTFTPASPLSPQTSYRIAPTSGITDLVGQGFPSVCSAQGCYTFTTQ